MMVYHIRYKKSPTNEVRWIKNLTAHPEAVCEYMWRNKEDFYDLWKDLYSDARGVKTQIDYI